jgi:hypothetical protein
LNARAAQERAADEVEGVPGSELELNLDTFDSFIDRRYPDRDQADRGTVSELVEELNAVGIDTIERWKSCWPGAMSNSRNTSRT